MFVNLEDETGLLNVICTPDVWRRYRKVARTHPRVEVRGMLERYQGVINVVAAASTSSRSPSPTCSAPATSTSSTAKGVRRAEFGQREPSSGRHQVRRSSP